MRARRARPRAAVHRSQLARRHLKNGALRCTMSPPPISRTLLRNGAVWRQPRPR
jgi:hypothetical protein